MGDHTYGPRTASALLIFFCGSPKFIQMYRSMVHTCAYECFCHCLSQAENRHHENVVGSLNF